MGAFSTFSRKFITSYSRGFSFENRGKPRYILARKRAEDYKKVYIEKQHYENTANGFHGKVRKGKWQSLQKKVRGGASAYYGKKRGNHGTENGDFDVRDCYKARKAQHVVHKLRYKNANYVAAYTHFRQESINQENAYGGIYNIVFHRCKLLAEPF